MDDLRPQFLIESRDLLADAAAHLGVLRRDPQATASIGSAFRAIHTLKGSVALFAMTPAETVLHAAEDMMQRAQKGTCSLDAGIIAALIACLDQIDRWIDDFERTGALPDDAARAAQACLAPLNPAPLDLAPLDLAPLASDAAGWDGGAAQAQTPDTANGGVWLDALRLREADSLAQIDRAVVAFRYQPDADCFFRGDDPLATVQAVPDLLAMAILPAQGDWPCASSIEPFVCFTLIEGVSAAPLDAVKAAFRMVPDQVAFAMIAPPPKMADETDGETASGPSGRTASRAVRSLRIDPARIDALGDTLGELAVAIHGFPALVDAAERIDLALATRLRAFHIDLSRVAANLQSNLGAVRSLPVGSGLRRLPRLAREIADSLGKPVDFSIDGQDIEVDRQVADGIFEPLLHIVRNAIDHGIETRQQRLDAGKSPTGKITLQVRRERDQIVVELADDGGGINVAKVRALARQRGVMPADDIAALSDAAALRLIFVPGFSTAGTVTHLSGRGVGMDAVRAAVARLGGSVDIDSTPGNGTTVRMALPVATLITRLLVVAAGDDRYGIDLDQVAETAALGSLRLVRAETGTACVVRDRTVPMVDLGALLGNQSAHDAGGKLLIVGSRDDQVALRVDRFCERIDAHVRPASGLLSLIPVVTGTCMLSDGAVLLVLDLVELMR